MEKEKDVNLHHHHPSCMLIGRILYLHEKVGRLALIETSFLVTHDSGMMCCRVPGNFHINMKAKFQNIFPPMANLSHVVNSLTFGSQYSVVQTRDILATVPEQLVSEGNVHPLDTATFVNR